jgi:hypothetical protein
LKTYSPRKIGEVINGLEIQTILRSERGQPVYGCLCTECGARGVPVHHEKFNNGAAKCISSMHGRSRYQPTTIQKVRAEEAEERRRSEEEQQRPVREAEAQLNATSRKLHELEKSEVLAGRRDPGFELPQSAAGLSMSMDQATEFVRKQAELFAAENSEYFPSKKNFDAITDYLVKHEIQIPTSDVFKLAWERLRRFGMIEERPTPAPEPQSTPVVEQPTEPAPEPQQDGLTDGWDIQTGQPRKYSEREIEHMSSDEFKKAFRMWVTRDADRRPKFNRSRYL